MQAIPRGIGGVVAVVDAAQLVEMVEVPRGLVKNDCRLERNARALRASSNLKGSRSRDDLLVGIIRITDHCPGVRWGRGPGGRRLECDCRSQERLIAARDGGVGRLLKLVET